MQRSFFGIAIATILTTSAMAADLAVKAPPIPPVVYDWTGFYIGLNLGYSWGRSSDQSTLTNFPLGLTYFTNTDRARMDGVVGGAQAGYNWQVTNWVLGIEEDIDGTGQRATRNFTCPTGVCTPATPTFTFVPGIGVFPGVPIPGPAVPFAMTQRLDWFSTIRGRVGYLVTPKVLLYGTGGFAFGQVSSSETIAGAPFGFTANDTRYGWTAGAGIEGIIAPNWTARLEYLYIDLGTSSGSFLTAIPANPVGVINSNFSSHITDNILRVGVNYTFNTPIVARY
jgi:outer membrane immunogenic protein